MVGLWVSPSRMSELMEFYKLRESGLTQGQALRKAEISALQKIRLRTHGIISVDWTWLLRRQSSQYLFRSLEIAALR